MRLGPRRALKPMLFPTPTPEWGKAETARQVRSLPALEAVGPPGQQTEVTEIQTPVELRGRVPRRPQRTERKVTARATTPLAPGRLDPGADQEVAQEALSQESQFKEDDWKG